MLGITPEPLAQVVPEEGSSAGPAALAVPASSPALPEGSLATLPASQLPGEAGPLFAAAKARRATVIIIAHRPNAIVHCTKLMVLDDGRIREFGPAEDVLAKVLPKQAASLRDTIKNLRQKLVGKPN